MEPGARKHGIEVLKLGCLTFVIFALLIALVILALIWGFSAEAQDGFRSLELVPEIRVWAWDGDPSLALLPPIAQGRLRVRNGWLCQGGGDPEYGECVKAPAYVILTNGVLQLASQQLIHDLSR